MSHPSFFMNATLACGAALLLSACNESGLRPWNWTNQHDPSRKEEPKKTTDDEDAASAAASDDEDDDGGRPPIGPTGAKPSGDRDALAKAAADAAARGASIQFFAALAGGADLDWALVTALASPDVATGTAGETAADRLIMGRWPGFYTHRRADPTRALVLAALRGNVDAVKKLEARGASVEEALGSAAAAGDVEAVAGIVKSGRTDPAIRARAIERIDATDKKVADEYAHHARTGGYTYALAITDRLRDGEKVTDAEYARRLDDFAARLARARAILSA